MPQVFRVDPIPVMAVAGNTPVNGSPALYAIAGATIGLYANQGCTVPATAYTDETGTTPCPLHAPVTLPGSTVPSSTAGKQGQFGFWLPEGLYYYKITLGSGVSHWPYPISVAGGGPTILSAPYALPAQFDFTPQQGGGDLSPGLNAITLNPVPAGITLGGTLYISGGAGTAEAASVAGWTPATGQAIINCSYAHSGPWSVQSASHGIQEAITGSTNPVLLSPGRTYIYGMVKVRPGVAVIGAGKADNPNGSGTYLDASVVTAGYVFDYPSQVLGAPYNDNSAFCFRDFTLKTGKNGIRLNYDTDPLPPSYQAALTDGVSISRVNVIGPSDHLSDPNKNTDIVPTLAELRAFGIGISLNNVFRARVEDCVSVGFGVPLYVYGDENVITGGAYAASSIGLYIYGGDHTGAIYLGNKNIIDNVKIGSVTRLGQIWTVLCGGTHITNVYFEGNTQYVRVVKCGTVVIGPNNWFQSYANWTASGPPASAPFHIDVSFGMIHGNAMLQGLYLNNPIEVLHDQYQQRYPNVLRMFGNGANFPQPGNTRYVGGSSPVYYDPIPGVLVGDLDTLQWTPFNNPAGYTFGSSAWPYIADPVTGRWAFSNVDPDANASAWQTMFRPTGSIYRTFDLKVAARKTGTGAVFVAVSYVGNATTALYSGFLNFTATTETEVLATGNVSIPPGETLAGHFVVSFNPPEALVEQLQFVPVS